FSKDWNPFMYLSTSILEPIIDNPYNLSITRIISWEYWNKDFGPNTGYLADAFANFGYFGMFLFSIMLSMLLKVLDSISVNLPTNFAPTLIIMPAIALTNSALFTTLLTHGFLVVLFALWVLYGLLERKNNRKT